MRVKALIRFKSKLSSSCHRFASLFRFKLKKPLFARPFHFKLRKPASISRRLPTLLSSFCCFLKRKKNRQKKMNASFSNATLLHSPLTPAKKLLFPSPVTPAYARTSKKPSSLIRESSNNDIVKDSCRSFENYLIHMIVEEGKVEDLMDIEELLYCWRNLKSPVFIDLVSRFYGELCSDLFSSDDDNEDNIVSHKAEK